MGTAYNPKIVTDGLVLCLDAANRKSYPGSGSTWTDLSGNNNTGTLTNGPTFTSDNGGSIVFDGTNDHISILASPSNILTTLTMECWFNASGAPLNGFHVMFQKEGGFSGGAVYGLRAQPASTFVAMICYDVLTTSQNFLNSTTTLTNGVWYHVSSTLDSSYSWKLYINGVLESSSTLTAYPFQNSSAIYIGTGDARYTNGKISNIKIYNRALSAEEISQNFQATRGRYGI
jgi:hypothetical protein